nr:RHS repeat-associated core domain-containing protein [Terriglobus albidus]
MKSTRFFIALLVRCTVAIAFFTTCDCSHALAGVGGHEADTASKRPAANAFLTTVLQAAKASGTSEVETTHPNAAKRTSGQSSTLLPDGRLLLTGGTEGENAVSSAFIEDPITGGVTQLPTGLLKARYGHTETVLPNGTVLILGGLGSDRTILVDAEIFDPATLTFHPIGTSGLAPRAFHTTTLLTDGRVLIAGGVSESGLATNLLEFWDYRSSIGETANAKLSLSRAAHIASLQADGTVFFKGGVDSNGNNLTSSEIFYPATQTVQILPVVPANNDAAMPSIARSLPQDGEQHVPLSTIIALRFSRPLAVTSLTQKTVTLQGQDGDVAVQIVAAEAGRLVFVTPSQILRAGSDYTLAISGAADPAGSQLAYSTVRFKTLGDGTDATTGNLVPASGPSDPFNSPARKLPPLKAPKGVTAVSGQVLQLDGEPLRNTTLQIGDVVAHTDGTGRFLLTNIPGGHQVMWIDGSTAKNGNLTYGIYEDGVDIIAKETNVLPYTIWMTALDKTNQVTIPSPTDRETIVSTPLLPGLELHLPAGAVIHDRNDKPVTKVGITPIPINQPPFPLPKGVKVPIYFTIQPGGAYLEGYDEGSNAPGARLFYPNPAQLPSGTSFNFWNYDADAKGWYVYGQGFVTADAKQIVPNPGVVIYEFTGAMVGNTSTPPKTGPNGANDQGKDGEPIDLQTGLFVYSKTDLALPDVIPATLTRTYRQMDSNSYAFGIGTMSNYDIYLAGDGSTYTYMDLILPNGGRVRYDRVSNGIGFGDGVFKNLSISTPFYGSTIVWDTSRSESGWTLTLKDGTRMFFPESFGATTFSQAALIGVVDRYGNTLTLTRDQNHNLTRVTSPNGRWIQYTYDTSNRVTQASDNAGRTVYYTYDTTGRLSTVKDANGGITTFGYDGNSNMTTIKDARNITYLTNYYDSHNMVWKQVMVDGSTYLFNYGLNALGITTYVVPGLTSFETDVTDPRGNVRKVYFNADGFVSSDIRAFGKPEQQTITYNRQAGTGLLLSVTDALNRTTSYTYDATGNPTSITRLSGTANATTTSLVYEPRFNQLASLTNAVGQTIALQYDNIGNLVEITNADGTTVTGSYNSAGQLGSITDEAGNTTQVVYSGGDLSGITDALHRSISLFVDEAGRTTSITNSLGQVQQINFDSLNQATQLTDPMGSATTFGYDPNGNVASVTDARNTATPTSFVFDNMDRLQAKTDQLGNPDSSTFDPNGNLIRYTDRRGKVTSYQYDALNRPTFIGFGTAAGPTYESSITYTWDAGDRITQAVDSGAGTTTIAYDDFDHVTSVTSPQGTIAYTSDAIGKRQTMTISGQPQISYTYDTGNRLTQITQGTSNVQFGYDSLGRRTSMTLPNGIVAKYAYDVASQLTGITYSTASLAIGDLKYSYDGAGRRTSVAGSFARTMLPQSITGNLYNVNNQLTQSASMTLAYDLNGNLTSDGLHTYSWNARNQLTSIDSGGSAAFAYDVFGRRATKSISGAVSTSVLYDRWNPVQEISGGSPTANLLTGGIDEYFTRTDASGTSNFLTDVLGSTIALTDASGTVQTQYSYDPFGNTTQSGVSSTNSLAFTGREFDVAGLYYFRARYYTPQTGRFLSEDPIGFNGGSTNLYSYVLDNPMSFEDPMGLSCKPKCFAQLKYRPVDDWRAKMIGATHSFWYVQGSSGQQYLISGGPWPQTGANQMLNEWVTPVTPGGTGAGPDNLGAPTAWDSGSSPNNCTGVDNLLNAANNWPQNTIPYSWHGPNSNSAAHSLGTAGGFNPTAPPGSVGWNTPIR